MKKLSLTLLVLVFLIITSLTACLDEPVGNKKIERDTMADNSIGDYLIDISDYAINEDEDGNPILGIKYIFTNNSDDAVSFSILDENVFQNGIGLEQKYFDENLHTMVQSGASIEIISGFLLNDLSDVTVEVSSDTIIDIEGILEGNEDDYKVSKVFKISE